MAFYGAQFAPQYASFGAPAFGGGFAPAQFGYGGGFAAPQFAAPAHYGAPYGAQFAAPQLGGWNLPTDMQPLGLRQPSNSQVRVLC